jgi:hypothetical protein
MHIRNLTFFTRTAPWLSKALLPDFSGMLSRKGGQAMINYLTKMVILLRGKLTPQYVRIVISFLREIVVLRRRSGINFTVKYLKACQILLMQSVSKQPNRAPGQAFGAAVSRTRGGLPRIIPKAHRSLIRGGSEFHIRFWITMFGLYRVLSYRGRISISTIITPGVGLPTSLLAEACVAMTLMIAHFGLVFLLPNWKPFQLLTRSSSSHATKPLGPRCPGSHMLSLLGSLHAWINPSVQAGQNTGQLKDFNFVSNYLARRSGLTYFISLARNFLWGGSDLFPPVTSALGRLGFKQEPAGKVRVFAMVDPWSQWLLRPLHRAIFDMLRQIPFDATFDQLGKVAWFKTQITDQKIKKVYSFDLTAATDRLPILLQVTILSVFLPLPVAQAWGRFLTDRWYVLPRPVWNPRAMKLWSLGLKPGFNNFCQFLTSNLELRSNEVTAVRYAVGQPMGALSSWAMLALTHHCIVWMAAIRGRVPTSEVLYLVLGDDIVIAHSVIAKHYLEILQELGCPVNLTKSIVSHNGSFEFAKRFIWCGHDVSPISWAEMCIALLDVRVLLGLTEKLPYLRVSDILNFMGHGYKAVSRLHARYSRISRSMGRLLLYLSIPGSRFATQGSFTRWLLSARYNVFEGHALHALTRGWILGLLMKLFRTIKHPSLPLSSFAVRLLLIQYFGDPSKTAQNLIDEGKVITRSALDFLATGLWNFYYGPLREEMKYSQAEVQGQFMRKMMAAKAVKFSAGPSFLTSMDSVFAYFWEIEETLASPTGVNESLFNEITDVVTLNTCRELKWADQLRSQFPRLNVGFGTALRKGSTKMK